MAAAVVAARVVALFVELVGRTEPCRMCSRAYCTERVVGRYVSVLL